jgi:peptidoglycan hydrolase-like protein with peptidoglycan-binding domain
MGPETRSAIKSFQAAAKLHVDGIYGTQTQSALISDSTNGRTVCVKSVPTSTTTTKPTSVTTTTASSGSSVPAAATSAITSYESTYGPAAGTWVIASSGRSSVDPTYVYFRIGPAPGHETTVQGGYGFVHGQGDSWAVTGFGSADVGCAPGNEKNQVVPAAVLAEFGVSCPTT